MELIKTLVPIPFLLGTREEQDVTQTQLVHLGFLSRDSTVAARGEKTKGMGGKCSPKQGF